MAGESEKEVEKSVTNVDNERTLKKKGMFSRFWGTIFGADRNDFEKRLKHISKEEAGILTRISKHSQRWRGITRQLLIFSVLLEVIAVGYAIMTTRALDLNWKMRAMQVLPMFLLPALSSLTYSALGRYTRMRDRKDNKTLEKLRTERLDKINELKEKTNYYITQQLIQRYDPDPAAKAAAATVLASKLGTDSGLKLYVGDDSNIGASTGKSNDVEVATTSGLRNRKSSLSKSISMDSKFLHDRDEMLDNVALEDDADISLQRQLIVEHHPQTGSNVKNEGWIARLAALLVGEDPKQSYAVICGNCHMHNGLARKEDFMYITYYCPHCKALNRSNQVSEGTFGSNSPTNNQVSEGAFGSNSPTNTSAITLEDHAYADVQASTAGGFNVDDTPVSDSPMAHVAGIYEK